VHGCCRIFSGSADPYSSQEKSTLPRTACASRQRCQRCRNRPDRGAIPSSRTDNVDCHRQQYHSHADDVADMNTDPKFDFPSGWQQAAFWLRTCRAGSRPRSCCIHARANIDQRTIAGVLTIGAVCRRFWGSNKRFAECLDPWQRCSSSDAHQPACVPDDIRHEHSRQQPLDPSKPNEPPKHVSFPSSSKNGG